MNIRDLDNGVYDEYEDDPWFTCDHAGPLCPDDCDCPCQGCEQVRDETACE